MYCYGQLWAYNCWPTNVCPNFQEDGATLKETIVFPSLVVTMKDKSWPQRFALLCQFWPQFLAIGCHPVIVPFIDTAWTSPAPPTFVMSTRLKKAWPLTVKWIPPFLLQVILENQNFDKRMKWHYKSHYEENICTKHYQLWIHIYEY